MTPPPIDWKKLTESDKKILSAKILRNSKSSGDCWLWLGACTHSKKKRYGSVWVPSKKGTEPVHRVIYMIFKGPIQKGLVIDHLCNRSLCINPKHLKETTHQRNILRGIGPTAKNAKKINCPSGHPYAGNNLMSIKTPKGISRFCRTCQRIKHRKQYAEKQRIKNDTKAKAIRALGDKK